MNDLDFLGCEESNVGIDFMSMLTGAAGGLFGGGDSKGGDAAAAAAKAKLEAAEASANNLKMILIGVAALGGALLITMVNKK